MFQNCETKSINSSEFFCKLEAEGMLQAGQIRYEADFGEQGTNTMARSQIKRSFDVLAGDETGRQGILWMVCIQGTGFPM